MLRVIVMGVSGSGKSAVGGRLADKLAVPFVDADDLHPAENKQKMGAGIPLDDEDRWPWLGAIGDTLSEHDEIVTACSALKRAYRDELRSSAPGLTFVHLVGEAELLSARLGGRVHEFMPSDLLESQLALLEELEPDERGFTVDVAATIEEIVDTIVDRLHELR